MVRSDSGVNVRVGTDYRREAGAFFVLIRGDLPLIRGCFVPELR